jgi:septal ring-binding cell division protein DamX
VSVPSSAPWRANRPPTTHAACHAGRQAVIQHITDTTTIKVAASAAATDAPVQPGPGCTTAHRPGPSDIEAPPTIRASTAAAIDPAAWAAR